MSLGVQVLLLVLAAGAAGAFGMLQILRWDGQIETKEQKRQRLHWENQEYVAQMARVREIRNWADQMMETVPKMSLRTNDRKILVTYGDLLKIWARCDDIADHLK